MTLEDQVVDVNVEIKDQSISVAGLSEALIFTDEIPLLAIATRTKRYFELTDIGSDWGTISKVYKFAAPHFAQNRHNSSIKIGVKEPKVIVGSLDITVASLIATVTSAAHGLIVGQKVTVFGADGADLNGQKTIQTVPTSGTFTYATTEADGADANNGSISYFSGDDNITAALNEIWDFDKDFFHLLSIFKTSADIAEINAWVEGKPLLHAFSIEDVGVKDSAVTNDIISTQAALNYDNSYGIWHHKSGVDAADIDITVASLIATVTKAAHGLRIGDLVTVSGADGADLNGNKTVSGVTDVDSWTYATTEGDGADANNGAIDYFARYAGFESAIQSLQLGKDIGTSSWAYKQVSGFSPSPKELLSDTEAITVRDKGGNVYVDLAGGGGSFWNGKMLSGRTIKVQAVKIWLETRLQEAGIQAFILTEQFLYTNGDLAKIANAMQVPLATQFSRGGITALNNTQNWLIDYKREADVPEADKLANVMKYDVTVRIGNEILKLEISVTGVI